jgi:hypothetical protein
MNPVSTSGRSMARARRGFRALVMTAGLLCSTLSTGCLRSMMLKQPDGQPQAPTQSSAAPAGNQPAPIPIPGTQVAPPSEDNPAFSSNAPVALTAAAPSVTPSIELQAAPAPLQAHAAEAPASPQPPPAIPPVTPPSVETPKANSTPLLDAAIERVSAVRQQQRDSLEPEASPAERDPVPLQPAAPDSPAAVSVSPDLKKPDKASSAVAIDSGSVVAPTLIKVDDSPAQSNAVPAGPGGELSARPAESPVKPEIVLVARADTPPKQAPVILPPTPPAVSDSRLPALPADDPNPLGIDKLRLCRKVHGFGSFEPIGESQVKAGQRILVYCEMTGMQYEAKNAAFVSRLASKIEICSAENGAVQWTRELGPAEDVCGSRRHDFYVNYRVDVPKTLAPGLYRLRLTQSDLIGHRTTSADLSFDIIP